MELYLLGSTITESMLKHLVQTMETHKDCTDVQLNGCKVNAPC